MSDSETIVVEPASTCCLFIGVYIHGHSPGSSTCWKIL